MFTKAFLIDAGERIVSTFIQGATASLVVTGFSSNEAWKAALVGGIAAALSTVKAIAANLPSTTSGE